MGSEGRVPKESLGGSRKVGIRERGRGWGLQEKDVTICGKDGELGRLWCGHRGWEFGEMDTPLPHHQGLLHGWVIWLVHMACTQADLKLMTLSLIPLPRRF